MKEGLVTLDQPPRWPGVTLTIALILGACGGADEASACRPRTIVVDGSASARSDERQLFAVDLVAAASVEAVICDETLNVVMVSGSGRVAAVLNGEDLGEIDLEGPTREIRESRLSRRQRIDLRSQAQQLLSAAYSITESEPTSITAMLTAAGDLSGPDTAVIVATDGVNDDDLASLNRPLGEGEGRELVDELPAIELEADSIAFVGVGLVDAGPTPSPLWETEVRAFVDELCRRTLRSAKCTVNGSVVISDLLS